MHSFFRATLAVALITLSSAAAVADDWVAVRLRGSVLQLVGGEWIKLERGAVVPDDRVIRTLRNGNVEFQRGNEHVTLTADTQIQIFDRGGAKPFTTVKQYFGGVTVDAEARNVQHFAVQTPYVAAVVKGTKFTVLSGTSGASVEVKRGHVQVQQNKSHAHVLVAAGQKASSDLGSGLSVSGRGKLPPVIGEDGDPVGVGDAAALLEAARLSGDRDAIKAAEKLLKDAEKAAKKEADDARKADKKAADAAKKAEEDARKAAEKAAKDDKKKKKKPGKHDEDEEDD